nr:hypothetical protein [Chloroflexota bacterium]
WVQDRQRYFLEIAEVDARLDRQMRRGYARVVAAAHKHGVTMRDAALILSVGSVVDTTRDRGIYP